jgi:cobalamin biosynthetic protein CobC
LSKFKSKGLNHGGRIIAAAEKYGIAKEDWLDLSTGLNPTGWPVANVPARIWQSLPEDNDGLEAAACKYYDCEACLPVAGSQAAIQILPTLRSFSKVGVISPTYAEHEYNWKQAGHDVIQLMADDVDAHIEQLDVLVVINPNNPTGKIIPIEQLLNWHQKLSTRGGWLIVDEAFMDVTPELSLIKAGIRPGLIILRSLGKFFGLAGVRCGFVITDTELLALLAEKIGPWSVTGPSRYVAIKALKDKAWQTEMRTSLIFNSEKLSNLLNEYGFFVNGESALFQWLKHEKAEELFILFAKQGILVRLFNESSAGISSLRLGLPKDQSQWDRLTEALSSISDSIKRKETKEALTNA